MKKPHGKGGRKEPASGDGDDIWWQTAATIQPLKRGKPRIHPATDAAKPEAPGRKPLPEPATAPGHNASALGAPTASHPTRVSPGKSSQSPAPALSTFDRNSARKIRLGRLEIEARVDLHGMRQDEAHRALRAFLVRCQNRGLRYVLVITGKGKITSDSDTRFGEPDRERGVLKRNVPRWLDEPDVRSIVVSYATAAIQHGGEGAIYVHLRSKDRSA